MTNIPNDDKASWISMAGSLVAAVSALSALLSVLYEYGYYYFGIGIPLQAVPASMSDHIKSCFKWLPMALFLLTLYFIYEVLRIVNEKQRGNDKDYHKENELLQNYDFVGFINFRTRKMKFVTLFGFVLFMLFMAITYIFNLPHVIKILSIISSTICLYFYVHIYVCNKLLLKRKYSDTISELALVVPFIIINIVFLGYFEGAFDITNKKYNYEVTLTDNSAPTIRANILRSYDKSTFFINSSQELVFIQNDQIRMITKKIVTNPASR